MGRTGSGRAQIGIRFLLYHIKIFLKLFPLAKKLLGKLMSLIRQLPL